MGKIFLFCLGVCPIAYLFGLEKLLPVLPLFIWFIISAIKVCCGIVPLFTNWREACRSFFSFPLFMFFCASLIWLGFASYAVKHLGSIMSFLWSILLLTVAIACVAMVVILLLAILLNANPGGAGRRRSRARSSGWASGLASASAFDDDWMTNPAYSHMPGNIHHFDDSFSSSSFSDDSFSSFSSSSSDWMTDPSYSFMSGNIFHHDDSFSSSSFSDDSFSSFSSSSSNWMTDPSYSFMSGNIFHHDE
ncbi:MAG: hypothetical protein LBQ75_09290 [Zoogloeaceae bacterium]|nr:hypothetical protein [Zoogloeaceae bacterium]